MIIYIKYEEICSETRLRESDVSPAKCRRLIRKEELSSLITQHFLKCSVYTPHTFKIWPRQKYK